MNEYEFTSKLQPDLLRAVRWVAMATNANDSRAFCHFINVKDDVLIATDGHRLHQVTLPPDSPIQDGVYRVRKVGGSKVALDLVDDPGLQLPELAWGMVEQIRNHGEPVDWQGGEAESSRASNLYTLIAAVGLVGGKNPKGFNPWYISDALEEAYLLASNTSDSLYLTNYEEEGTPRYEARIMGFRA